MMDELGAAAWIEVRAGDPLYPARVGEAIPASRVLRLCGDPRVLRRRPCIAVVGTRTPTRDVARLTRVIIAEAASAHFVAVSGLSPGVDTVAHEAALRAGIPTVAVVPWGGARPPRGPRHALARRIVRGGGVIVSAFPPDAEESPGRRLWRNRLIAGLADVLIVVASEPGGGAWNARHHALRLQRMVLSPIDP